MDNRILRVIRRRSVKLREVRSLPTNEMEISHGRVSWETRLQSLNQGALASSVALDEQFTLAT
jgi:hypothetical protein